MNTDRDHTIPPRWERGGGGESTEGGAKAGESAQQGSGRRLEWWQARSKTIVS